MKFEEEAQECSPDEERMKTNDSSFSDAWENAKMSIHCA
jgi:hypothetical protein